MRPIENPYEAAAGPRRTPRRHSRRDRRRHVVAALLLALGTTSVTLAWIAVTLASYAWWGSPRSPLGALWWPGFGLFAVWAVCRAGHWWLLRRCGRRSPRARD